MRTILKQLIFSGGLLVILCSLKNCSRPNEVPINEDDTIVEEIDLSSIKRIALFTFIGASKSSPSDTLHYTLLNSMWNKFEFLMEDDTIIEFIPVEQTINNEIYKTSISDSLPGTFYSPVNELSYLETSNDEDIDCGPLLESLNADAGLVVIVEFGNRVHYKTTDFYITAYVESGLVIPPEKTIWQLTASSKYYFEENIPVSSVKNPFLVLGFGFREAFFSSPTEKQYSKLTKYAIDNDTKFAENVAESLYNSLQSSLQN